MSGRFERHARSREYWDSQPSRSAERASAADEGMREPARKAPGRKDTRSWCKGKPGVEHVPSIILDHTQPQLGQQPPCRWMAGWSFKAREEVVYWTCPHHEACDRCGKVLRDRWTVPVTECPDYPGQPEQRAEEEAKLPALEEERAAWEQRWRFRKPVIAGPQGYRRRR